MNNCIFPLLSLFKGKLVQSDFEYIALIPEGYELIGWRTEENAL